VADFNPHNHYLFLPMSLLTNVLINTSTYAGSDHFNQIVRKIIRKVNSPHLNICLHLTNQRSRSHHLMFIPKRTLGENMAAKLLSSLPLWA
jgi:hypothetical protein